MATIYADSWLAELDPDTTLSRVLKKGDILADTGGDETRVILT